MAKASDNAFPSLLITEGTEPSAPAAGKQRLYIDSTTHKLKRTDSSGTDVDIESAAATSEFTEISAVKRTSGNLTTTSATFVDATGLTVTITTAAVRCLITFIGWGNSTSSGTASVDLNIDGTRVGGTFGLMSCSGSGLHGNLGFTFVTDVLSAASHTFKIQIRNDAGFTTTLFASSTAPAIIQVLETKLAT